MHFLQYFYLKVIKHDLSNKFVYINTKKIPTLKKIIINFGCKNNDIKTIASSLLALELITTQKGKLTVTKHSNILLKIRKGNPTGCKVTLRKKNMFNFLIKLIIEIFPILKNFLGFDKKIIKKMQQKALSWELYEMFSFSELERNYYLFYNLPKLNITFITDSRSKNELLFILKSFLFPFSKSKYNSIGRV